MILLSYEVALYYALISLTAILFLSFKNFFELLLINKIVCKNRTTKEEAEIF